MMSGGYDGYGERGKNHIEAMACDCLTEILDGRSDFRAGEKTPYGKHNQER